MYSRRCGRAVVRPGVGRGGCMRESEQYLCMPVLAVLCSSGHGRWHFLNRVMRAKHVHARISRNKYSLRCGRAMEHGTRRNEYLRSERRTPNLDCLQLVRAAVSHNSQCLFYTRVLQETEPRSAAPRDERRRTCQAGAVATSGPQATDRARTAQFKLSHSRRQP